MMVTVRVPATSANLGPGFDALGLALELCNEVSAETATAAHVAWEGEGRDELPIDGSDLVSVAIRRVAESVGADLPPLSVRAVNAIPIGRGLGSSAAAVVAGVMLGRRVLGLPDDPASVLALAASIEGHADNVAASTHGGLTIAYEVDGVARAVRLDPSPDLRPVLLVPTRLSLATEEARRALPAQVSLRDAVHNASRAALAVVALTSRVDLLSDAVDDRIHQSVRLGLVPEAEEMFRVLRARGLPVCVSGAGPTLLAFESPDAEVGDPGPGWRTLHVSPRRTGAELVAA
jgi:homoserine kinase